MATASSQPTASSAHAPPVGPVQPSHSGGPLLSQSPTTLASSLPAPGAVANGGPNGLSHPLIAPADGSPGADMRIYPRDGRVRNPVPSKLKNVNEQMKGNFGVMHMDVASHRASEGRDAAAKRTSESTALQAKLAQTDVYVSHQRRANYPRPPGLKQFSSSSGKPEESSPVTSGPPRPLTFAETKAEQARLLTLLRSLPHHTVVDQICKGLAFFGGIPDAPPPADGKFPESAEANGAGNLFVGWIAEIFPDLDHPRPRFVEVPTPRVAVQKRPRGRPKGSKASKTRSDKGLKKGSQKPGKGAADQTNDHDDSWIDVDDTVLDPHDNRDLAEAIEALRDGASTPTGLNGSGMSTTTPATDSAAGFRSINDTSIASSSSAKKRGRPKGSKNRPKDKSALQTMPPPKVTPVPVPVPMLDTPSKSKSSAGKSKSNKSRSGPSTENPNDDSVTIMSSQQHQVDPIGAPDLSVVPTRAPPMDFAADSLTTTVTNGAITHNHESLQPALGTTTGLPSPASQIKASTVTAKKRKRPIANVAAQGDITGSQAGASTSGQHAQPNTIQVSPPTQLQGHATPPLHQPAPINVAVPPAKRVRKSQESSSTATARRQTPNSMGQKAPVLPTTAVSETTHQPDTGDMAQSHPAAEGLEAHYAAMQSHTDQMQSYNSRPQLKQQPHSSSSIGSAVSPAPAAAPAPTGGLDAHLEHFTALQNLPDSSRQTATGRQKQQQPAQTSSPVPSQPSKPPQMPAPLNPQQQNRASQNYYSPGPGLGSPYTSQQQPSYSSTQRQQQHLSNASPNAGLVPHVTNSPQFSTQSNSPLMQTDNNYRGSPSLMHNNAPFGTRRTPSASPLDNTAYRPSGGTTHGVASHSPHFGTRPAPTTATTHTASHSGLTSAFPTFPDSTLFDMNMDSSSSHSSMGIGGPSYALSSGTVPQQQRSSGSNAASLYSSSGMNNSYLGQTNMGRTGQQNRWTS